MLHPQTGNLCTPSLEVKVAVLSKKTQDTAGGDWAEQWTLPVLEQPVLSLLACPANSDCKRVIFPVPAAIPARVGVEFGTTLDAIGRNDLAAETPLGGARKQ